MTIMLLSILIAKLFGSRTSLRIVPNRPRALSKQLALLHASQPRGVYRPQTKRFGACSRGYTSHMLSLDRFGFQGSAEKG